MADNWLLQNDPICFPGIGCPENICCNQETVFTFPFNLKGSLNLKGSRSKGSLDLKGSKLKGSLNLRGSNRKENCYHDYVPFNLKGNKNLFISV